jgi:hypothetical protein
MDMDAIRKLPGYSDQNLSDQDQYNDNLKYINSVKSFIEELDQIINGTRNDDNLESGPIELATFTYNNNEYTFTKEQIFKDQKKRTELISLLDSIIINLNNILGTPIDTPTDKELLERVPITPPPTWEQRVRNFVRRNKPSDAARSTTLQATANIANLGTLGGKKKSKRTTKKRGGKELLLSEEIVKVSNLSNLRQTPDPYQQAQDAGRYQDIPQPFSAAMTSFGIIENNQILSRLNPRLSTGGAKKTSKKATKKK